MGFTGDDEEQIRSIAKEYAKEYAKDYMDQQVAIILPLLDRDTLIINRQYRKRCGEWLYELPGGKLDPGEAPDVAALRELKEETGYSAGRLTPIFESYLVAGISSRKSHFYLAEGLVEGNPEREENELIETIKMPLDTALGMIRKGEMADAKSVSCILYYAEFLHAGRGRRGDA